MGQTPDTWIFRRVIPSRGYVKPRFAPGVGPAKGTINQTRQTKATFADGTYENVIDTWTARTVGDGRWISRHTSESRIAAEPWMGSTIFRKSCIGQSCRVTTEMFLVFGQPWRMGRDGTLFVVVSPEISIQEIIDDDSQVATRPKHELFCAIPGGPRDVKTSLYYNPITASGPFASAVQPSRVALAKSKSGGRPMQDDGLSQLCPQESEDWVSNSSDIEQQRAGL